MLVLGITRVGDALEESSQPGWRFAAVAAGDCSAEAEMARVAGKEWATEKGERRAPSAAAGKREGMAGKRARVGARVGAAEARRGAAAGRERKAQAPAGRSATRGEAIGGALLAWGTEGGPG